MTREERLAQSAVRMRYALIAVLLGLAYLAFRRLGATDAYWLSGRAYLLVLVATAPSLVYLRRAAEAPERAERLPLLPVLGLIHAVYYGLPPLLVDRPTFMSAAPSSAALQAGVDLVLFGWLALLAGYHLPLGKAPTRAAFRLDEQRALALAWPLALLGFGCHLLLRSGSVPAALEQPVLLVSWLHQIGVGIGIIAALRGRLGGVARAAVLLLGVPSLFLVQFGAYGVGPLVFVALFVLYLVWAVRGAVPWSLVLPALALLLLIKGGVSEFRRALATSAPGSTTQWERARLLTDLVRAHVGGGNAASAVLDAGRTVRDRTSMIALFAHVIERTPEHVAHWRGDSYRALPASVVPRAVWPDKPTKQLGQTFGHAFGLLAPDDVGTSINLPQTVELFVNFGASGVVIGMALFGWLYRWLARRLAGWDADDGTILVGALIFARLAGVESDTSLVWGTVLQAAIVLYLCFRLFGARS
ncbi:MAG: hypothetical protein WD226_14150 [Planctomycetota bacterium]